MPLLLGSGGAARYHNLVVRGGDAYSPGRDDSGYTLQDDHGDGYGGNGYGEY